MEAFEHKLKYAEVKEHIYTLIRRGRYKPGDVIPSERDLAKEFNVNRATASRALKELEADGFVERKQGLGTYVSEEINQLASVSLTHNIGLVIYDLAYLSMPYMTQVLRGINQMLYAYGYNLILYGLTGTEESKILPLEEIVKKPQVDGLLIDAGPNTIKYLCEEGFPFVQFGSNTSQLLGYDYNSIFIDSDSVIRKSVEHLYNRGRRRIAFLRGTVGLSPVERTIDTFLEISRGLGMTDNHDFVRVCGYGEESGRNMVKDIFSSEPYPDAILANEDMIAMGAMEELKKLGFRIPEDVAIIGNGDYYLNSNLTTIRLPHYELGSKATEMLIQTISLNNIEAEKETQVLLDVELVVRET